MSKLLKKILSSLCCLASTGLLSNAGSNSKRVRLTNGEAKVRGTEIKEVKKAKGSTRKKLFKKLGQNDVRVNGKRDEVKVNGKWHPAIEIGGGVFLVFSAGGIYYFVSGKKNKKTDLKELAKELELDEKNKGLDEKNKKTDLKELAEELGLDKKYFHHLSFFPSIKVELTLHYSKSRTHGDNVDVKIFKRGDDDSGNKELASWNMKYAANLFSTDDDGLASGYGSFCFSWFNKEYLDEKKYTLSLFSSEKDDKLKEFKLAALGIVANYLYECNTLNNIGKVKKVEKGLTGDFPNFVKFIELVDSITTWK